jgi:hypothetical protein
MSKACFKEGFNESVIKSNKIIWNQISVEDPLDAAYNEILVFSLSLNYKH